MSSNVIGPGLIEFDFRIGQAATGAEQFLLFLWDGTNDNRLIVSVRPDGTVRMDVYTAGTFAVRLDTLQALQSDTDVSMRIQIAADDWALAIDDQEVQRATAGAVPANLKSVLVGRNLSGGNVADIAIGSLAYFAGDDLTSPRCVSKLPEYWARHHNKVGLNLAVGEFTPHQIPGIFGQHYVYPLDADFDWAQQHGFKLIRMSVRAERLWPGLIQGYDDPPLLDVEMARVDEALDRARQRDMTVILDVRGSHNYNNWGADPARIAKLWGLIAERYKSEDGLIAYGLTNEPHGPADVWEEQARAAVQAIRAVDQNHVIVCPVILNALQTPTNHPIPFADDPFNRTVYDGHFYAQDNSGFYGDPTDISATDLIAQRMAILGDWADQHGVPWMIGEFGTPSDPWGPTGWEPVLQAACEFIRDRASPCTATAWAAGPWWPDSYVLKLSQLTDGSTPNSTTLLSGFAG